jgi:hypothetical protein
MAILSKKDKNNKKKMKKPNNEKNKHNFYSDKVKKLMS